MKGDDFMTRRKKTFTFKFVPSSCGKSSTEVVDALIKQTINKVLIQSEQHTIYENKRL